MKRLGKIDTRRDAPWLALIVCAGLLIRFAAIILYDHTPSSDELAYKSMALNLLGGNGIVDDFGNHAMYNVGYPLFVLYPVFLFFGEDLFMARATNALLGGLAVFLCYAVAKEAGAGRLSRLLAALFWAMYLPASIYTVYIFKENLMTPIMLGAFWFVLRFSKEPRYSFAIACGTLFGLLALVGNAALSLGGALFFALIIARTSMVDKVRYLFVTLTFAALIATPWMIRNYHVIGAPVLNTNGGFNLYLGNNPAATGMFVSIADTPRGDNWEVLRERGEVYASETLKRDAINWIVANPLSFLYLSFKKAVYFWTPPLHRGRGEQSRLEEIIRVVWATQFFLLVLGAFATIVMKQVRIRDVALMWIAVAGYTAVHMLFYVIFRYRVPIMPFLCIMAALSLEALLTNYSSPLRNSGGSSPGPRGHEKESDRG